MPRLFLIDGSSQMYRAYHAIRGLTGPDGRSTNAVYGFATMLRKLIADQSPEYIAASFDLAGKTFRDDLSATYKANRAPMPSDLAEQVPLVHEACEALGVPVLTSDRFEADDVIGTLATQAHGAGYDVAIVTGDKDFFQLVRDGIRVFNPRDPGTWYDDAGVVEKFGVRPDQVVDVLALMGDSVDNIKGVPGIGEKGARDLISQHGNLDALLAAAPTVQQKRYREGLMTYADDARLSRELAKIRTDVPVTFSPDALRYGGPLAERCFALFSSLGFRGLTAEFAPVAKSIDRHYNVATTGAELDQLAAKLSAADQIGVAAISSDTSGVRASVVGWSFSAEPGVATYVPIAHTGLTDTPNVPERELFAKVGPALANPEIGKAGHDLKFISLAMDRCGANLQGPLFDTEIASYLIDATRSTHSIEGLAIERANYKAVSDEELTGKGIKAITLDAVPADSLSRFAGERADLPLSLATGLHEDLAREKLDPVYRDLEEPLIPVLVSMERAGVGVDTAALASLAGRMQTDLDELAVGIYRHAGGEFQLTDAIQSLLGQEQVLAYRYQGTRYDCGSKLGYLKATVEYALKHPEVGAGFRDYLGEQNKKGEAS